MSEVVGHVAALWRFPVKSMLGEQLDALEIGPRGVAGDRAYALIDADSGKVVSAKNPRKFGRLLEVQAAFVDEPVATPEAPSPPVQITLPDGTNVRSDSAGVDDTLSAFLGRPVHLAATAPDRRTMEEVWPDVDGLAPESFIEQTRIPSDDPASGEVVSDIAVGMAAPPGTFFDLSLLHLLTTSTLDRLRELNPEGDFDVRRYRPNVLVQTSEPGFVENDWVGHTASFGAAGAAGAAMRIDLPTMRCIMTTLPQPSLGLDRDPSLLLTIARNNRIPIAGGQWACAGSYGSVAAPGRVAVGDPVTLSAPASAPASD